MPYCFFLFGSPSSSSCIFQAFDSISTDIDNVLSIKPSLETFKVHHKDCLTYSRETDRPGELEWPYPDGYLYYSDP